MPRAHPQVASELPGWGRRPPLLGIRGSLTCSSRLSLVFSSGQAFSSSSGRQEGGSFGSQHQHSLAQSDCPARLGPLTGLWTRPGLPGLSHGSQVRSTVSEAAEGPGFGEPESGGVRTPLHSIRGLGCTPPYHHFFKFEGVLKPKDLRTAKLVDLEGLFHFKNYIIL